MSQERDQYIVRAIDEEGKSGAEVATDLGIGRGQVYNIYKRVTSRYPGKKPAPAEPSAASALQPVSTLEALAGCIEPTSCTLRAGLPFDSWAEIVQSLRVMHDSSPWWLGDVLNYGQAAYGEKYAQAVDATGKNVQTLQNAAWVASRISPSRRRDDLTWSHHAEVASMDPAQADGYLQIAAEEGWTRNELRRHIQDGRRVERQERIEQPAGNERAIPGTPARTAERISPPVTDNARVTTPARDDRDRPQQPPSDGLPEFFAGLAPGEDRPGVLPDFVPSNLSQRPAEYAPEDNLPPSTLDSAMKVVDAARLLATDFLDLRLQSRLKAEVERFDIATGRTEAVTIDHPNLSAQCPLCKHPDMGKCPCEPDAVNAAIAARDARDARNAVAGSSGTSP